MDKASDLIAGIVIVIAIVLIVPHIGNELWINAHAVDLVIVAALIGLLIIVSMQLRDNE